MDLGLSGKRALVLGASRGLGAVIAQTLAAEGASRVAVVPIFLAQGGHLKRDLPVLLEEARAAHPGCEITRATAAGEADPVVAAMADYALGCLG